MSQAEELHARLKTFAALVVGFIRSTSPAANYRAARSARSHDECVAKLGTVSEDMDEWVSWLTRAMKAHDDRHAVDLHALQSEAEQLARIAATSHRAAKKRQRRRFTRRLLTGRFERADGLHMRGVRE